MAIGKKKKKKSLIVFLFFHRHRAQPPLLNSLKNLFLRQTVNQLGRKEQNTVHGGQSRTGGPIKISECKPTAGRGRWKRRLTEKVWGGCPREWEEEGRFRGKATYTRSNSG